MGRLSNISYKKFTDFLKAQGLKNTKTEGDHEKWTRSDLGRPIIVQANVSPVPEFIIQSNLKTLGISKKEFIAFIGN